MGVTSCAAVIVLQQAALTQTDEPFLNFYSRNKIKSSFLASEAPDFLETSLLLLSLLN